MRKKFYVSVTASDGTTWYHGPYKTHRAAAKAKHQVEPRYQRHFLMVVERASVENVEVRALPEEVV